MVENRIGSGNFIKFLPAEKISNSASVETSVEERTVKVYRNRGARKEIRGFFSKLLRQYLWIPYKETYTRSKEQTQVHVHYSSESLSLETLNFINKFNIIDPDDMANGLSKEHGEYLRELYNKAVKEGRLPEPDIEEMIIKIIEATPKKPWIPGTLKDWAILDKMEFALTQKYFEFVCDLFNSPGYLSLPFVSELEEKFGVNWSEKMVAEALSRKLAYIGNLGGKSIDLPVLGENGCYVLQKCRIISFPLGENLPAYIIDPEDKAFSPWFAIRGTAFNTTLDKDGHELRKGGFESVVADTYDPKSIGQRVVNYSMVTTKEVAFDGENVKRMTLIGLIEKFDKEGRPLTVVGHSLGGNIADIIGIRFFHKIKRVHGDDPPAVCKKMQRLWEKRIDEAVKHSANPKQARKLAERKIVNFLCEGSMVPGGGLKVVGLNLAVTPDCYNHKKSTLYYHSLHLSTINSTITEVDNKKENKKAIRLLMEQIRQFGGWLFSLYIGLSPGSRTPQWWVHRKRVDRILKSDISRFGKYC